LRWAKFLVDLLMVMVARPHLLKLPLRTGNAVPHAAHAAPTLKYLIAQAAMCDRCTYMSTVTPLICERDSIRDGPYDLGLG
jgi:hypothetical protein